MQSVVHGRPWQQLRFRTLQTVHRDMKVTWWIHTCMYWSPRVLHATSYTSNVEFVGRRRTEAPVKAIPLKTILFRYLWFKQASDVHNSRLYAHIQLYTVHYTHVTRGSPDGKTRILQVFVDGSVSPWVPMRHHMGHSALPRRTTATAFNTSFLPACSRLPG